MKYKLIKTLPGLPELKLGSISLPINKQGFFIDFKEDFQFRKSTVEAFPNYFAPYLFTTNDNVDVYKGDWYCPIVNGNIWELQQATCDSYEYPTKSDIKYFSTEEAAQLYLDTQKHKYTAGQWMLHEHTEFKILFRYVKSGTAGNVIGKEVYTIYKRLNKVDIDLPEVAICNVEQCYPATQAQIQLILSSVAKSKGFKAGVKYINAYPNGIATHCRAADTYFYDNSIDGLFPMEQGSGWVYVKGKWGKLVTETIKQKNPIKITLSSNAVVESDEKIAIVDYDVNGNIVGFEVLL